MLVLSRKVTERIVVPTADGEIVLTINKIRGSSVSIGVEAPADVRILRGELFDAEGESPAIEHGQGHHELSTVELTAQ